MYTQEAALQLECLLDERETAAFLKISVRTLQDWRLSQAGPPFIRVGRNVRYRRSDIMGWIEDRTYGRPSPQALRT